MKEEKEWEIATTRRQRKTTRSEIKVTKNSNQSLYLLKQMKQTESIQTNWVETSQKSTKWKTPWSVEGMKKKSFNRKIFNIHQQLWFTEGCFQELEQTPYRLERQILRSFLTRRGSSIKITTKSDKVRFSTSTSKKSSFFINLKFYERYKVVRMVKNFYAKEMLKKCEMYFKKYCPRKAHSIKELFKCITWTTLIWKQGYTHTIIFLTIWTCYVPNNLQCILPFWSTFTQPNYHPSINNLTSVTKVASPEDDCKFIITETLWNKYSIIFKQWSPLPPKYENKNANSIHILYFCDMEPKKDVMK